MFFCILSCAFKKLELSHKLFCCMAISWLVFCVLEGALFYQNDGGIIYFYLHLADFIMLKPASPPDRMMWEHLIVQCFGTDHMLWMKITLVLFLSWGLWTWRSHPHWQMFCLNSSFEMLARYNWSIRCRGNVIKFTKLVLGNVRCRMHVGRFIANSIRNVCRHLQ